MNAAPQYLWSGKDQPASGVCQRRVFKRLHLVSTNSNIDATLPYTTTYDNQLYPTSSSNSPIDLFRIIFSVISYTTSFMNSTNIPNLPTEIHEHIIDCLAMDQAEHYPIDIALDLPRIKRSTLATCATTCRNWLPRARMHIFQTVSLRQASHLTLLKDSPGIWSHIRTLEVHENIDIQPYAHLVSYYFATKLPSLTGLQVRRANFSSRSPFDRLKNSSIIALDLLASSSLTTRF